MRQTKFYCNSRVKKIKGFIIDKITTLKKEHFYGCSLIAKNMWYFKNIKEHGRHNMALISPLTFIYTKTECIVKLFLLYRDWILFLDHRKKLFLKYNNIIIYFTIVVHVHIEFNTDHILSWLYLIQDEIKLYFLYLPENIIQNTYFIYILRWIESIFTKYIFGRDIICF